MRGSSSVSGLVLWRSQAMELRCLRQSRLRIKPEPLLTSKQRQDGATLPQVGVTILEHGGSPPLKGYGRRKHVPPRA